jgi:thioredoxin-related protein
MEHRKAILIAFLTVMLLFVYYAINAAPLITDEDYTYLGDLRWYKTYENGSAVAKELNKPMFLYFWTIWCPYCEKMQTEVFPQPEINKLLRENFVLIAIDMDVNRKDTQRFGVQYPPHELFLTPEGEVITRIPGYVPAEKFLPVLEEVASRYGGRL